MNYIPLRVKTNYSLLTSLNTIESLAKRAKELNINALSITDDNIFGVMEFYKTILKYDIPNLYIAPSAPSHLTIDGVISQQVRAHNIENIREHRQM